MTPTQIGVALATMARREAKRIFRIWSQTLLPPVITTGLYFAVFWTFLGGKIGEVHGVAYPVFIVPGLVMLAVIGNAFSNVATATYMAKFQRNIEEVLVAPIPAWAVTLGFASGGVVRGLLIGGIIIAVSSVFVSLPFAHVGIIVLSIILTTLLFSFMGMVNGLYAKSFDGVSIIPTFVLTPLTYLGGVFYSADTLPGVWRTVSHLNPVYYMVDLFRYGFIGTSTVSPWVGTLVLVVGIAIFWGWSYRIIETGKGLKS